MATIYTLNGKVLKNASNGKWLVKAEPVGFVMDGSNATYTLQGSMYFVSWQSPSYPDVYNGDGKQYILVNNNATAPSSNPLMYVDVPTYAGTPAITGADMAVLGTSTGILLNNTPAAGPDTCGKYLNWPNPVSDATLEQLKAYMANVSITIVDP